MLLRTPDQRFENLPDYPFAPHYLEVGDVRLHYVDEGTSDEVILCLHGEPSWSYLYRHMIPPLANAGFRVVAPDLVGFGKSDKFPEQSDYSYAKHAEILRGFIEGLDLKNITIVVQDWGGLLGLNTVRELPERFSRLVIMNTGLPTGEEPMPEAFMQWRDFSRNVPDMPIGKIIDNATATKLSPEIIAAYDAPFPDASYKAGAAIFPSLVPISTDQGGSAELKATRQFLSGWEKPALVMFSDQDPITRGGDRWFRKLIPSATNEPAITIENAGHFLQEDKGGEIAQQIIEFIRRHS